jgi:hypothetical protein
MAHECQLDFLLKGIVAPNVSGHRISPPHITGRGKEKVGHTDESPLKGRKNQINTH